MIKSLTKLFLQLILIDGASIKNEILFSWWLADSSCRVIVAHCFNSHSQSQLPPPGDLCPLRSYPSHSGPRSFLAVLHVQPRHCRRGYRRVSGPVCSFAGCGSIGVPAELAVPQPYQGPAGHVGYPAAGPVFRRPFLVFQSHGGRFGAQSSVLGAGNGYPHCRLGRIGGG